MQSWNVPLGGGFTISTTTLGCGDAVASAVNRWGLHTVPGAPIVTWTADPTGALRERNTLLWSIPAVLDACCLAVVFNRWRRRRNGRSTTA